jgi:hypothetical protein
MPHEGPHLTRTKITPDLLAFAVSQDHDVMLRVDLPGEDATVILQMKPADAREIAAALVAKAAEAEKGGGAKRKPARGADRAHRRRRRCRRDSVPTP